MAGSSSRPRCVDDIGGVEEQPSRIVEAPELIQIEPVEATSPFRSELPVRGENQLTGRRQCQEPREQRAKAGHVPWCEFKKRTGAGVTRSGAQHIVGEEGAIRIVCEFEISKVVKHTVEPVELSLKARCRPAMRLATRITNNRERRFWRGLRSGQANAKDLD